MERILITGGAGFIGSNLTLKLFNLGYEVTVLDNLSKQIHGVDAVASPLYLTIKDKVNFIRGNVTNASDWALALRGQHAIVHLAAETGTGQSMYEIARYADVNVRGTSILLDYIANKEHTIEKIIVASSRAIYGEGKYKCTTHDVVFPESRKEVDMSGGDFECKCPYCKGPVEFLATSEDSKIQPNSIYGVTKQNQEQMVMMIGKALNIPSVALRYQNVYGPGQSLTNPYTGILSIFSNLIRNNKPINIFEDGKESRDFVFIDDVVDATISGLENDNANFEVFNVGSDKPIDVISVAKKLMENYDKKNELYISGNFRIGDIRHNYADLSKIEQKLGYKPKVPFEEGIKRFCNWVLSQELYESNYERSVNELKEKGLFK